MISNADRRQILDSFIKNIASMSDKEYQERVWVRAEGPDCDDIDDTICDFFDEDYILEKYQDFGITEGQYELLMKLHGKLRNFIDTYGVYSSKKSTEKLIALPQWQEIRDLAKKVLQAFNFKKTNAKH
ncbi:MAG: hypothetical protein Tsb0015_17270 [Simkaniaceae bacterium]